MTKYSVRVNGDWTRLLEIHFAGFDAGSEITGSYHGGPITGKVLENLKPSEVLQNLGMTDSITFSFEWAAGQQEFVGWRDFKGTTLAGYFTGTVASDSTIIGIHGWRPKLTESCQLGLGTMVSR